LRREAPAATGLVRCEAVAIPRVFPIFPLPQVILVPGALVPLHVFERRYRDMVADALAGERFIAMAYPLTSPDEDGRPPVLPVCGLGEIVQHVVLPDGRSNIVLEGVARMEIEREVESAKLYREVVAHPLEDQDAPASELGQGALALFLRVEALLEQTAPPARALPWQRLLDLILLRLQLPVREKYEVFAMTDPRARLRELERRVTRMERRTYSDGFEPGDPRLN